MVGATSYLLLPDLHFAHVVLCLLLLPPLQVLHHALLPPLLTTQHIVNRFWCTGIIRVMNAKLRIFLYICATL